MDDVDPRFLFRWDWQVLTPGGEVRTQASHSTLEAEALSAAQWQRRAPEFRGTVNEDGRIDLLILERLAAAIALGDIARELARTFPRRFPAWQQAMGRVGGIASVYGVSRQV